MSDHPSERRRFPRYPLASSVEFFHGASRREFPGRSVDISKGGMLMYVPATVPVHPGQTVRLNLSNVARREFVDHDESHINATIVRVDRQPLLATGHIAVGMQFEA